MSSTQQEDNETGPASLPKTQMHKISIRIWEQTEHVTKRVNEREASGRDVTDTWDTVRDCSRLREWIMYILYTQPQTIFWEYEYAEMSLNGSSYWETKQEVTRWSTSPARYTCKIRCTVIDKTREVHHHHTQKSVQETCVVSVTSEPVFFIYLFIFFLLFCL